MKHNTFEKQNNFPNKTFTPNYVKKVEAPKNENSPFQVTDLLKYVLEMRYMTLRQLKKKFMKVSEEISEQQFLFEIDKLLKLGHLRSKDVNLTDDSLTLVTDSGREIVVKENPDKKIPVVKKSIFQPRVKHDLLLNDLRIRFEELNFLNKWA